MIDPFELVPIYLNYTFGSSQNRYVPACADAIPNINDVWPSGFEMPKTSGTPIARNVWDGHEFICFLPYNTVGLQDPLFTSSYFLDGSVYVYLGDSYYLSDLIDYSYVSGGFHTVPDYVFASESYVTYATRFSIDGAQNGPWVIRWIGGYDNGATSGAIGGPLGNAPFYRVDYEGLETPIVSPPWPSGPVTHFQPTDITSFGPSDMGNNLICGNFDSTLGAGLCLQQDSEAWFSVHGSGSVTIEIELGNSEPYPDGPNFGDEATGTPSLSQTGAYFSVGSSDSCFNAIDPNNWILKTVNYAHHGNTVSDYYNDSGDESQSFSHIFTTSTFIDPEKCRHGWGVFRVKPIVSSGSTQYYLYSIKVTPNNIINWGPPFVQQQNISGVPTNSTINFE